jgi:hypothetical protein
LVTTLQVDEVLRVYPITDELYQEWVKLSLNDGIKSDWPVVLNLLLDNELVEHFHLLSLSQSFEILLTDWISQVIHNWGIDVVNLDLNFSWTVFVEI